MNCEIILRCFVAECSAWIFFSEPCEQYEKDLTAARTLIKTLIAEDFEAAVTLAEATRKCRDLFYDALKQVMIKLASLNRVEEAKRIAEKVNIELLKN